MTSHPINYLCTVYVYMFPMMSNDMIFEGSCDAENSALITGIITYILKYITIEKLF